MPLVYIAIVAIIVEIVLLVISTKRRLIEFNKDMKSAMSQIGVQLTGCFDALASFLLMVNDDMKCESITILELIKLNRSIIMETSTPEEVLRQEGLIAEVLERISMMTEQCPEVKAYQNYNKTMEAVDNFENMVRTSRLIYNSSVAKYNRELLRFPVFLIAGILGYRQKMFL